MFYDHSSLSTGSHEAGFAKYAGKGKKIPLLFRSALVVTLFLGLAACGPGEDKKDPTDSSLETVDVFITAQFPGAGPNALAKGTVDDVLSVGVEVRETPFALGASVLPETELTETPPGSDNWEGTLTGLPIDISLDFRAKAYDAAALGGTAIFTDTVTETLTTAAPSTTIIFSMEAIDDGIQPTLPVIVSATMQSEIETFSTGNIISFDISHTGPVDYSVSVSGGTVTPTSGTHDPTSGNLDISYDAPDTPGTYTVTLTVNDVNEPEATVSTTYPINVVLSPGGASVTVNLFGPAITGIHFSRAPTALDIEVDVAPPSGMSYAWEGTDSFAGLTGTTNPISIDPFADTDAGNLTVTVTDSNDPPIQTALTHTIAAGDFPYTLNLLVTAVEIAAGQYHTCARMADGSVKCWGGNQFGQLGLGDTAWRGDQPGEMGDSLPSIDLGMGRTAMEIAAGYYHTCALLDNGSVKCWGANNYGRLGLGDTEHRGDQVGEMGDNLPAIALGTGRSAVEIAAGSDHTCALLDNGSVKCWGNNLRGQLGVGDTNDRGDQPGEMGDALPAIDMGTARTVVEIAAGHSHNCARLDDGSLKCWGTGSWLGLAIPMIAAINRERWGTAFPPSTSARAAPPWRSPQVIDTSAPCWTTAR